MTMYTCELMLLADLKQLQGVGLNLETLVYYRPPVAFGSNSLYTIVLMEGYNRIKLL